MKNRTRVDADVQKVIDEVRRRMRFRKIRFKRFYLDNLAPQLGVSPVAALAGFAMLASQGKLELRVLAYCSDGHRCSETSFSEGFPNDKVCHRHQDDLPATTFEFVAVVIDKKKQGAEN